MDSALSDVGNLSSGVVQVSVIGPLLFLLYINDVVSLLADDSFTGKLYADDLKIYTSLQINEDTSATEARRIVHLVRLMADANIE